MKRSFRSAITTGMLPCFLNRQGVTFVLQHLQGLDQFHSGIGGVYDVIQVAAAGCDVGRGELLFVVVNEFPPGLFRDFPTAGSHRGR